MQLKSTTIRKMSIEKLGELLAQDMEKISDTYSFAFSSKTDAINLMDSFLKSEYSNIVNDKKESIDFYSTFEDVMNNYIRAIFETDYESAYTKLFNNYMEAKVGEITGYQQNHYEVKKIINFFETIGYQPSEIVCSNILENNPKFSTMIGKIVDRYSEKLSTMNTEEIFSNPTMLSLVTTYAFINEIELKTNEEEQEDIDYVSLPNLDTYSDDNVKLYINSLPKALLPSEQRRLFIELKEGNIEAKVKLIETNLRLVLPVAFHHKNRGVDLLDLIQEGNIGLMKAVDKFDYERGCAFSTYAHWWIKNYISRGVMKYGKTISTPTYIQAMVNQYNLNFNELTRKLKSYPTQKEIIEELNLTDKELRQLMMVNSKIVSLDAPLGIDNDLPLSEIIAADDLSIEEEYEKKTLAAEIRCLLNSDLLNDRTIEILKLRNGFYDNRVYSCREVGELLKISRQRVDEIEKNAYKKLRNSKDSDAVLAYLVNGTKIREKIIKEQNLELATRKANKLQISQKEKNDVRKVYTYFSGYKKEEIAKVISTLSEQDLEIVKELFGSDLKELAYRNEASTTSLEKYSKQIIPVIESKLNSDYIKITNYCTKDNNLSSDYDKTEYYSLDSNKFEEYKYKITYVNIKKSLLASFQTNNSVPSSKMKVSDQSLQNARSKQPKILMYK